MSSKRMAENSVNHHPQFIKVLMPGFNTKLGIPPAFFKYIKSEKLETATIVSPLGKQWCVKVQGEISSLYLGEGWSDFVQFHDLRMGYFLVFRHLGNMVFSVRVFDWSCCKKEYMPAAGRGGVKNKKIKRENPNPETFFESKRYDSRRPKTSGKESYCNPWFQWTVTSTRSRMYNIRVSSAFRAATDISTKHEVTLRDPAKRLFPVRLLQTTENRTVLGKGWKDFYFSNNLKAGDVCEFLYSTEENTMQVHIFKQLTSPRGPAADSKDKTKAKAANPTSPRRFEARNSMALAMPTSSCTPGGFRLTMTPAYVNKAFMYIPVSCKGATRIWSLPKVILRDPEGRVFPVRICHGSRKSFERLFTASWKEFCVSNDLKPGDTCEFQLLDDSKENLVQVQILRG